MRNSPPLHQKIYDPAAGLSLPSWLAAFPRPLVFTNGCFDILHQGHVLYLEQSANLGATLIVGVNSDASVRQLGKGTDRPIIPLQHRMTVLAALAVVDGVLPFEQKTPEQLIAQIKPDHLVKGGDWAVEQIVGGQQVMEDGGKVHSSKLISATLNSSSAIIERIRYSTPKAR